MDIASAQASVRRRGSQQRLRYVAPNEEIVALLREESTLIDSYGERYDGHTNDVDFLLIKLMK